MPRCGRSDTLTALGLTILLFGCDNSARSPISPLAAPTVSPAPTSPSSSSSVPAAVLVAKVTATQASSSTYHLKILVTETTGQNAASVQTIVVKSKGITDYGCPLAIRVGAGETVDLIEKAGYCAPDDPTGPAADISVSITYVSEGHSGIVLNVSPSFD